MVDALVLVELGRDAGQFGGVVSAVHVQFFHRSRRAEALLHPGAPGLELDLALRLQDAQHLLGALGREPLARREPGDRLVLPEERHPAALLPVADARVEHDHRDPGGHGLLDRRADGCRVGVGDRDAVYLAVDRGLDQGGLLGGILVIGVVHGHVVLGRRGGLALPDDVPEGVARRGVRDHGERVVRGVGLACRYPRSRLRGLLPAGAAAGGEDEGGERDERSRQRPCSESRHVRCLLWHRMCLTPGPSVAR